MPSFISCLDHFLVFHCSNRKTTKAEGDGSMETDRVEEGVQEVTGKAAWECNIGKNSPCNPREDSFRKRWCVHLLTLNSQEVKDAGADWPWGK